MLNGLPKKKRNRSKVLRCGCQFSIQMEYCIPTYPDPNNAYNKLRWAKQRYTPELKMCKVSSSSIYAHTNGCKPSYHQGVMQAKAAGTLFERESSLMDHLLTIMEISDKHVSNEHLRAELKLINPSQSHVTSIQLYNFRRWAKEEISRRKQAGSSKKVIS